MQPIISGTTTERIVRTTLLTVLLNGFAIAFLWDGYVGYARENIEQLASSLGIDVDVLPEINPLLTSGRAQFFVDLLNEATGVKSLTFDLALESSSLAEPGDTSFTVPKSLRIHLEPGRSEDEARLDTTTIEFESAVFRHKGLWYYLGPGGYLCFKLAQTQIESAEWRNGVHTETDQAMQRLLGQLLGLVGLVLLCQFVRVLATRVSITDAGLKVRGRLLIPFAAMTTLRAGPSGKTGLVHLEYTRNGRKGLLRLDNYVVKQSDAIIAAICEQTGLPDPRRPSE